MLGRSWPVPQEAKSLRQHRGKLGLLLLCCRIGEWGRVPAPEEGYVYALPLLAATAVAEHCKAWTGGEQVLRSYLVSGVCSRPLLS